LVAIERLAVGRLLREKFDVSTHQVHVFISHSWSYPSHYDTLAGWIFGEKWSIGQAGIDFRDFSVPKNDPIHSAPNETALKTAIFNKIMRSHVIVIPTGVYATHSKWIQKEIEGAVTYRKPIVAVDPWGQVRTSEIVRNAAEITVGWNKEPLINAIWNEYFKRA
jgi:hypothetical protein